MGTDDYFSFRACDTSVVAIETPHAALNGQISNESGQLSPTDIAINVLRDC